MCSALLQSRAHTTTYTRRYASCRPTTSALGPPVVTDDRLARASRDLRLPGDRRLIEEFERQNQELARARRLQSRQQELLRLHRELEDTNRGVVTLHTELDDRA